MLDVRPVGSSAFTSATGAANVFGRIEAASVVALKVSNFAQTPRCGYAICATTGVLLTHPGLEAAACDHLSGRRFYTKQGRLMCGWPPACKNFLRDEQWSLAVMCPAFLRGRT